MYIFRNILFAIPFIGLGQTAAAYDITAIIDQCNAPITVMERVMHEHDAQSDAWSVLNMAISEHRRNCAVPMALTCHVSDAPAQCFSALIDALDALTETERQKLVDYQNAGQPVWPTMAESAAQTPDQRRTIADQHCRSQSTQAGIAIRVLNGDAETACRMEVALNFWAQMASVGAAPQALSLLPPQ